MATIEQHFDSLTDCHEAVSRTPSNTENAREWKSTFHTSSNQSIAWYGIPGGLPAVKQAVTHGWPEGVDRLEQALQDLPDIPMPRIPRRRMTWQAQGDIVSMPRVWSGQLDTAWQRCSRQQVSGRQPITIYADICNNARTDARELFWRGAAVVRLTDLLTERGYSTEIIACTDARRAYIDGSGNRQSVRVKHAGEPLDKNALASTICLAGFFRTYIFAATYQASVTVTPGLGQATPYPVPDGAIGDTFKIRDSVTARQWIIDQVALLAPGE